MFILEAAVCGGVELYSIVLTYFDQPISISEDRLSNRNIFVFNSIQFNSSTNYNLQNDHSVESAPLFNCFNIN